MAQIKNLLASATLLFIFCVLIVQTKVRYGSNNGSFTIRLQSSQRLDDAEIQTLLNENCDAVELNRKELSGEMNTLVFSVTIVDLDALNRLSDQLTYKDPNLEVSIIESKGQW